MHETRHTQGKCIATIESGTNNRMGKMSLTGMNTEEGVSRWAHKPSILPSLPPITFDIISCNSPYRQQTWLWLNAVCNTCNVLHTTADK